jgi:predicted O-methyltransferase YrrM
MIKSALKRLSFTLFDYGQAVGLLILPNHYYSPVSSTRALRKTVASWNQPIDLSHLPIDRDRQREVLARLSTFQAEYADNGAYQRASRQLAGPGYGPIEAQALHGFVRAFRPRRVIEIGSGVSTMCMLEAIRANESAGLGTTAITCIEPHPSEPLKAAPVKLLKSAVENVALSLFDELETGDLLFVDSTHAFRPVGDVSRIYLEIFPKLKPGVLIHVHDVYIPYSFQRDLERSYMQSMETALLIAMLAHSTRYEVLLCMSQLHYEDPDLLKQAFPTYSPRKNVGGLDDPTDVSGHFPSSIYMHVN